MRTIRIISTFLGIAMFAFGVLKLVSPFKEWYSVQISRSTMNQSAYWPGIISEIFVGLLFISSVLFRKKLPKKIFRNVTMLACAILIMIMVTAIRVHLHPDVPAMVLPLQIKPPFIPAFFLLLAITNLYLIRRLGSRNR